MRIRYFLGLSAGLLLSAASVEAQTLFTYGGHPVSKEEFMAVYNKNNQNKINNKTSVSDYLNLYALFRMKVQDALDMKMDTTAAVVNELDNYKAQLTRTELLDKTVTSRLVREAYDRMKTDVKVAHILVAVHPNEDSVRAKNKIDSIYRVLESRPEDFEALAKSLSDDQTTASNGGELGYITALQTPYHFETAAYNTPVGQFSKPFRTNFGYHIIKVEARRPDPGQVQVAQILVGCPDYKDADFRAEAKKLAGDIDQKLKNGADFTALVAQYSDDKYTKDAKGVMPPFGIGEMTPDFEQAAFALEDPGDISAPVVTTYGYHILKLIKHIPLQPLDSIRDELTLKVKNDARERQAKDVYMEKVKQDYHFRDFSANYQQLVTAVLKDSGRSLSPTRFPRLMQPLFELDGQKYSQAAFLAYADKMTQGNFVGRKEYVLRDLYATYVDKSVTDLQQQKLMESDPKYRDMINEYKNGILLFDLMDKKVWNKASSDTSGLKAFYEKNQDKYKWPAGVEGTLFYADNKAALEKLQHYIDQGEDIQVALDKVHQDMPGNAEIKSQAGRYAFGQIPLAQESLAAHKATAVFNNPDSKGFGMIYVSKVYPDDELKSLDDARGFVMADYQDYLEKQWEQQLMKKYPLKINDRVLKKVEQQVD
ncbi:MAG TPA: peptidylprolyl isomerase [Edaphocola sp.]|nr:peptidylprolyl isomerase [Edaphocola sp.]